MSGGPLHWFRKHQKIMLVVFGVILMVVFTVGTMFENMANSGGQQTEPVRQVASTSFGSFTNKQLDDWYEANQKTSGFTGELWQLAKQSQDASGNFVSEAKANPISPINAASREQRDREILRRMALAKYAEEQGAYVGEETIEEYFNKLCNNELGNKGQTVKEFNIELQRYSLSEIKNHLKTELLAVYAQRILYAGIGHSTATPLEVWEGHKRLNEKAEIEYMPIPVDDFLSKVTGDPSDKDLKDLFEKGEDKAISFGQGPGFKTPRTVNVGYFALDRKKFLETEKAKITEAEIRTQYDDWVYNNDRRVLEEEPTSTKLPGNDGVFQPKNTDSAPGLESPKNLPANDDASDPKTEDPNKATAETPNKTEPAKVEPKKTEEPKTTEPAKTDPAKTEPKKAEQPEPKKDAEKQPEPKLESPKKEDQGNLNFEDSTFQFVSLQDEPKKQATDQEKSKQAPAKQEPAKAPSPPNQGTDPAAPKQAEPKKQEDNKPTKQDTPTTDDLPTIEEPKTANPKGVTQDPMPKQATDQTAPPTNEKPPTSIAPSDVQKAIAEAAKQAEDNKPKIKPLDDEMRDLIRGELAQEATNTAIKNILEAASTKVDDYLFDYGDFLNDPDTYSEPKRPNFDKIATTYGLTFKEFENVEYNILRESEFGKSRVNSAEFRGAVVSKIFGTDFEKRATSSVEQTVTNDDDIQFIYWVTDRKDSQRVSFEVAKPAVIEYYNRTQALELAKKHAQKIAADVSGQNKRLSAEFGDKVVTSDEFGWLSSNPLWELSMNPQFRNQLGNQPPANIGQIKPKKADEQSTEEPEPIEAIGNEFFEQVFDLDQDEIGYAVNATKDTVYVFQVIKKVTMKEPEKDMLFTASPHRIASAVGQYDQEAPLREIIFSVPLMEKYSVKWFGEHESK